MIKYSDIETTFASYDLIVHEYNIETDEEIETPFIVYTATDGEAFNADGVNFINFLNISMALIDETMNFPLQEMIEKVFADNDISFDKNINFDDGERLYSIGYTFTVFDDHGVV